jgi:hypothetical protein
MNSKHSRRIVPHKTRSPEVREPAFGAPSDPSPPNFIFQRTAFVWYWSKASVFGEESFVGVVQRVVFRNRQFR